MAQRKFYLIRALENFGHRHDCKRHEIMIATKGDREGLLCRGCDSLQPLTDEGPGKWEEAFVEIILQVNLSQSERGTIAQMR